MSRKFLWISVCGGVLLGTYLLGVVIFYGHCGFRTYVNGKSVFMMSADEIVLDINKSVQCQMLTLKRRDGTSEKISYAQLGVLLKHQPLVVDFSQNSFLWFTQLFHRTDYHLDMSLELSEDVVLANVDKLECLSDDYVKKPVQGYVKLLEDGSYEVVSDSSGNEIDKGKLVFAICNSILQGKHVLDLESAGVYKEDLIPMRNLDVETSLSKSAIEKLSVNINVGGNVSEQIPDEVLKNCVYELKGKTYIRYSGVYQYVEHLSRLYDTVGTTRTFHTSLGSDIQLSPSDGDTFFGWELNSLDTTAAICDALANQSTNVSAVWVSKGKSHDVANDFGNTYVELSIKDQHMWCYVDGNLLFDTDVTTGTYSVPNRRTPTGMFMTMDWNTEYTMRGSYGTAFSHYFIRLTPTGIGIHDSSWRSKYGGEEYINHGSHGCINTPYDKVKLLYDTLHSSAKSGVPVIIY